MLFARNLAAFVLAFTRDGGFHVDLDDPVQRGALITHDGQVTHERTRDALERMTR